MNRRTFLMSTAAAATTLRGSANDRIRVACVGVHGQGKSHINAYSKMDNVEIAAICDVDQSVLDKGVALAEKATGKKPDAVVDFRRLLDDKSIDAVSLATPNFWHTLETIWALDAGKHVYCEKPCAYNMFEARQIVAAAKKHPNLMAQHGTNSRSGPAVQEAMQHIRDGLIGEVYLARGLCFKWRDTIGRALPEPVPPGVDYNLWTGPAPLKPFTQNRFHYKWHWFWDYGNGDLGNQGIHELDIALWGLGGGYPTKVTAIGGHFMFDDDQETPNTITALYEFDGTGTGKKKMMEFSVRHWMTNHEAGIGEPHEPGERKQRNTVGNIFYGSKGYLAVDGYGTYYSFLGPKQEPGPSRTEPGNNWKNFIDAVRSGKREDLNAPIEVGAPSTVLIHLANISYQVGRTVRFDPNTWTCPGDREATALFTRREGYRKPFVVPEKI